MGRYDRCDVSDLLGKTLVRCEEISGADRDDQIIFETADGESFRMFHAQDCCEHVSIEDINGSLDDLIGSPITLAEESQSSEAPEGEEAPRDESYTWTFYRLATVKGYVNIRWYGSSNGYYSEHADFERC